MHSLKKSFLEDSYKSGASMPVIAKRNKISVNKVAYWMKKHGIISRTRGEAAYLKKNPKGDPFKIANLEDLEIKQLQALGIALYLGEGSKTNHGIRLSNADPKIIRLFLIFLDKVCGVEKEKIRAWINIFDDSIYDESLMYWVEQTRIPKSAFYSPVIRKRKDGSYKNKSLCGTITIIVDNQKLQQQINKWCDEFLEKYADMAQW